MTSTTLHEIRSKQYFGLLSVFHRLQDGERREEGIQRAKDDTDGSLRGHSGRSCCIESANHGMSEFRGQHQEQVHLDVRFDGCDLVWMDLRPR